MESEYIYSKIKWISHPPDKKWIEHSLRVEELSKKFLKDLPDCINVLLPGEVWQILINNISFFHDIGKGTKYFQDYIVSENKVKTELSNHSLLSSLVTYWIVEKLLEPIIKDSNLIKLYSFIAFLVVRYHHGDLQNPKTSILLEQNQISLIRKQWESIDKDVINLLLNFRNVPLSYDEIDMRIKALPESFKIKKVIIKFLLNNKKFDYYFIINILYSILIDADKLAAGLNFVPESNIEIPENIIDIYREIKGWIESKGFFDKLRNDAYREVINSVEDIDNRNIFSIQLPTGFGKTFASLSFAIKLLNKKGLKRIIYCLPFTSIIDQNYYEIQNMFETVLKREVDATLLLKHHHLSELFFKYEDKEYSYSESQLLTESWHSKVIVTTFVQLFHTLIGYKNRALKKFHRLLNSVIILDEVQSIPIKYWKVIGEMLSFLSGNLNCNIILVTATQPKILPEEKVLKLANSEKYFKSINRTHLKINIQNNMNVNQLVEYVKAHSTGKKKIIVVLNTIKVSADFYSKTKNSFKNAYYLSSYIIPKQRLEILRHINRLDEYYLVSTQIIEAGVNLDADILFRDFATMDSINQVAGRCNRFNMKNAGEVHVFKLEDNERGRLVASYIYDKSLLDITEKTLIDKTKYEEKEFLYLCDCYYDKLSSFNSIESEKILDSIRKLKYTDDDYAISTFKLIDENYEKFDVFIEYDSEAENIWGRYCALNEIKDFWKKREEYLKIKNKLQNYIISVNIKDLELNKPPMVNGIYYVSRNQLEEYYDTETGYKKISSASIW